MSPVHILPRFYAGVLLAGLAACAQAAALPDAFTVAMEQAGIPLTHVAVQVQPLDADQPLISHNADAALNPASTMKLVTSFAALHQLGPDYTWTTDVWADGPIADGVLQGDLIVKGHGDPTLTLERMWLLQRALRARGVRHIDGGLVLDTTHFELPAIDPGAFDDAPLALYNAPPGALVANFNASTVRLKPAADRVLIVPDLALPGVAFHSRLMLVDSACTGWRSALVPAFADAARKELTVDGVYPRDCGEQMWSLSLFAPAATFDFVFRSLWAESGGTLAGPTLAGGAPASGPLLEFASEPLSQALHRLNKHSNNLMTRNLFLTLGAQRHGAPATLEKGEEAVRELLARHGVPTHTLVLENGAGLSRIERASADTLTHLLQAAYRSPLFAEFQSALPIVALDGTLKRRFNGSTVSGSAHLKSGTLRDVSALAGYVHTAAGQRVSLVLLINHANAGRSEMAQRALLEWVYSIPPAGACGTAR